MDRLIITLEGDEEYLELSESVVLQSVEPLPRGNARRGAEYSGELLLPGRRTALLDFHKLDLCGGLRFDEDLKL